MANPSSIGHRPGGAWAFDDTVVECFDDMIARSIPGFAAMRELTTELAAAYLAGGGGVVVDIGCSRGGSVLPLLERFGDRITCLAVDESEPMVAAARETLSPWIADGAAMVRRLDLRNGYPDLMADVTLSILTLQFTPIEHRLRILHDAYRHTRPGGAFILIEKVLGETPALNACQVDLYHRFKEASGYSREDIETKRRALEGAMVPVTAEVNRTWLHAAGFDQVDCFYRHLNFAGFVATRAEAR